MKKDIEIQPGFELLHACAIRTPSGVRHLDTQLAGIAAKKYLGTK